MRTIIEQFNVYEYNEASPELKEKIGENFRYDPDFGHWILEERISTLKTLAKEIGACLDYSISLTPDRGEFIDLSDFDENLLKRLLDNGESCPLTGICYDDDLLDSIKKYRHRGLKGAVAQATIDYINDIHNEYESLFTDENLSDYCEANDYEFNERGYIYA